MPVGSCRMFVNRFRMSVNRCGAFVRGVGGLGVIVGGSATIVGGPAVTEETRKPAENVAFCSKLTENRAFFAENGSFWALKLIETDEIALVSSDENMGLKGYFPEKM